MTSMKLIHSTIAADPVLGEIVALFVQEMPDRIETLLARAEANDWDAVGRTAHQLKGALGSHGFGQLTPIAKQLESSVREGLPEEEVREALDELVTICGRLRPGTP